ncbi:hypothetical protein SAMN02910456_00640 [Ruminococcaceae bacterium YRB3002]|nr:hypothetical protein SAMN02910456_00640 [Ruminococcaceae bacterium YRB3002]
MLQLFGKKKSVQELLGIKTFTNYGLATDKCELLFYQVSPTNISVLSKDAITTKIRQLMLALSAKPNLEFVCTDASECFDNNKVYLAERIDEEPNPLIRSLLAKDHEFLDNIQLEMATARQFAFVVRCRNMKPEQVFAEMNRVEKTISDQGFDVKRMSKEDIKRFLAIYFDASFTGDQMPDVDGAQWFTNSS